MVFPCLLSCFILLGVSSDYGKPTSQPELSITPRIITEKDAGPGAWPWNVVLLNRHGAPRCGGVLINSNWVITAAHCNVTMSYRAVVGLHDLHSPGNDTQILRIAQIFRHPMFNRSTMYGDITLLKLRREVHFNSKVSPLHLPSLYDQFLPRSSCKIMGLGYTHPNGSKHPDKLVQASVPIMDSRLCMSYFRHISHVVMFCVGRKGAGFTPGNTSGSLACQKNGVWTLAGIISFSAEISPTIKPLVVTRTTAFLSWIELVMTLT